MNHECRHLLNFVNKLITEFLPSILSSEAFFGHPVEEGCLEGSYTDKQEM